MCDGFIYLFCFFLLKGGGGRGKGVKGKMGFFRVWIRIRDGDKGRRKCQKRRGEWYTGLGR